MSRPVDALIDFLRSEEVRGVTHIHLDDQAKELLRELHRRARAPKTAPVRAASEPVRAIAEAPAAAAAQPAPAFVPDVSAPAAL
ncbi:MAG: hypothetical protein EOP83_28530 [Verrucomicrobiaceae bacterium]|nr:MAG: hypothetical protein EOP83_28530 [Verrucomicrobiaceae bacterium]